MVEVTSDRREQFHVAAAVIVSSLASPAAELGEASEAGDRVASSSVYVAYNLVKEERRR